MTHGTKDSEPVPGCKVQGYLLRRQRILAAKCAGSISGIQAWSRRKQLVAVSCGGARSSRGAQAFHARSKVHTVSEQAVLDPLVRTNVPARIQ